jgi:hypothetical protein
LLKFLERDNLSLKDPLSPGIRPAGFLIMSGEDILTVSSHRRQEERAMADQFFNSRASRGACRGPRSQVRAGRSGTEAAAVLSAAVLQPEFRLRMERAFGESFSDIVVRPSRAVDAYFGGVAATVGQSILTGDGFHSLTRPWRERVLAHELAHVVQKRRSPHTSANAALDPRYRSRLEAEAHLAAIDAIQGRQAMCRLPDIPSIPSAWGPAGHYWTCYYVMLAAGVDEDEAQERAFFCQMPDQVREFDASSARIDWLELDLGIPRGSPLAIRGLGQLFPPVDPGSVPLHRAHPIASHGLDTRLDLRGDTGEQTPEALAEAMALRRLDLDVAEGLHSLTGGNAGAELMYRQEQLSLFAEDPLIFGLALHAYGDSYAHVDTNDGGLERQATGISANKASASSTRAGAGASKPKIGQASLYRQYVANLYGVVCDTLRTNRNRQVGQAAVLDALGELAGMQFLPQAALLDDPDRQRAECQVVRSAIRKSLNRAPSSSFPFAPEEDGEVYWRQFWPRYPDIITRAGGQQIVFDQVRKMGHLWRT